MKARGVAYYCALPPTSMNERCLAGRQVLCGQNGWTGEINGYMSGLGCRRPYNWCLYMNGLY